MRAGETERLERVTMEGAVEGLERETKKEVRAGERDG